MNDLSLRAQATIIALISEIDSLSIPYVIARNYENFPDFGHDLDLFFSDAHLPAFVEVAKCVAVEKKWDYLTQCSHWSTSRLREHNIEVFRFYKIKPIEYLQVDLFHGFLIWGLPLVDNSAILETRTFDTTRKFYRMHPALENSLRMLQIAKLVPESGAANKVQIYRNQVLGYSSSGDGELHSYASTVFLSNIVRPLNELKHNRMKIFYMAIFWIKARFLIKKFLQHPWQTVAQIIERLKEYTRLFYTAPCGFILRAYAPTESERHRLFASLEILRANKALACWSKKNANKGNIGMHERKIMERGGIVLKLVNSSQGAMLNTLLYRNHDLAEVILMLLVRRHPVLISGDTK